MQLVELLRARVQRNLVALKGLERLARLVQLAHEHALLLLALIKPRLGAVELQKAGKGACGRRRAVVS